MSYQKICEQRKIYLSQYNELSPVLIKLSQMNFIKFGEIFQNMFYMLGYTKEQINLPNSNILNWKEVKSKNNIQIYSMTPFIIPSMSSNVLVPKLKLLRLICISIESWTD